MAAALVKYRRELAESRNSRITSTATRLSQGGSKRHRHVRKVDTSTSAIDYIRLLDTCKSSDQTLRVLIRIFDTYCTLLFKEEDVDSIVSKLTVHFKKERESLVRAKIFDLLGKIGGESIVHITSIEDIIAQLLKNEKSHLPISRGITASFKLGQLMPDNVCLHEKLVSFAIKMLADTSHLVKCACFNLIGGLVTIGPSYDVTNQITLRLVSDHVHNVDARVRSAAFRTMIHLHGRGLKVNPDVYSEVCLSLKDDYEVVRRVAMQLIWVLAQSYPEKVIILDNNVRVRLVDDAFAKLCNAGNDLSMHVRRYAVELLGSMAQVSAKFLDQTLSKSIRSNMKKKCAAHEQARESAPSGEWASGNMWEDGAPCEVVDGETLGLLSCGVFIHGLEDEYQEVRIASINSICSLALKHSEFARSSLDFLVDMFNDEIEEVRLNAINSLTKISKYTMLKENQLETILSTLKDFSIDVRQGLRSILVNCRLYTRDCLKMCVERLVENLKKYPIDKKSTWHCMQKIGQLNAQETLLIAQELLAVHPYLDTPVPDIEDPSYVSILILIFNAAQHCPTMRQLFETHIVEQYVLLRDTMPKLIPTLKLQGILDRTELMPKETGNENIKGLESIIVKIKLAKDPEYRDNLLQTAKENFIVIANVHQSLSGTAQFLALYFGGQVLMGKVLRYKNWCNPHALTCDSEKFLQNTMSELLHHCFKLQYLFIGLQEKDLALVKQFKLKALTLQLVFYIARRTNMAEFKLCDHFIEQAEDIQKFLTENYIQPETFTLSVLKEISFIKQAYPRQVAKRLFPLLLRVKIAPPPKPNTNVRIMTATIVEPTGDNAIDIPKTFIAGLTLAVPFHAEIKNLSANANVLRIKVAYANQKTYLIVPKLVDLKPLYSEALTEPQNLNSCNISDAKDLGMYSGIQNQTAESKMLSTDSLNTNHRLLTTIHLMSEKSWSYACTVDVSLALDLTKTENAFHALGSVGPGGNRKVQPTLVDPCLDPCIIDLCKPVKVKVFPKSKPAGRLDFHKWATGQKFQHHVAMSDKSNRK